MARPTSVLVVVGLLVGGCMIRNSKENLVDALHRFNAGFKWGRAEWMADYVEPASREKLIVRRQEFGDLQITGCEVQRVQMKGKDQAVAGVRVEWYLVSTGAVRTSRLSQTWKKRGREWKVVAQRQVGGARFPLVTGAVPAAAADDEGRRPVRSISLREGQPAPRPAN